MAEKEKVIICDECDWKIAKEKCNLCGKDLCSDCSKSFTLELKSTSQQTEFYTLINYCSECRGKVIKMRGNFWDDFKPKVVKNIVDYVRKSMIIENLKEDTKDGK